VPSEVRIGEIISAMEVNIGGERRVVIDAKVTGDIQRFLDELAVHSLTIFMTVEPELCGIQGKPEEEVLSCQLRKGHKERYHRSGRFRWLGYHVKDVADV
jgi:hypothetical protein